MSEQKNESEQKVQVPAKTEPAPSPDYIQFQTMEEVRAYLDGSKIQCLECGKYYRRLLYTHLRLHDMTADDYRAKFGIPWTFSLTSKDSREATSRSYQPGSRAAIQNLRRVKGDVRYPDRRHRMPAVINRWRENLKMGPVNAIRGPKGTYISRKAA